MAPRQPSGHLPTSHSPLCVQGTPHHCHSHPGALKEGETEAQRHDDLSTLHAEWQRKGFSLDLSSSVSLVFLPLSFLSGSLLR